jgi:hypothetical protein
MLYNRIGSSLILKTLGISWNNGYWSKHKLEYQGKFFVYEENVPANVRPEFENKGRKPLFNVRLYISEEGIFRDLNMWADISSFEAYPVFYYKGRPVDIDTFDVDYDLEAAERAANDHYSVEKFSYHDANFDMKQGVYLDNGQKMTPQEIQGFLDSLSKDDRDKLREALFERDAPSGNWRK